MPVSSPVVTRFAPSPTGYLHIGGARTALFNYLYARKHGGEFRLRIEDTDRARSTPAATQAILDGMAWLGLAHDGEVIYQSRRDDRHRQVVDALLESGYAYRCYLSDTETASIRDRAKASGHAFRSPHRDGQDHSGDHAVRFRVPDGSTTITDRVRGDVVWENTQFDDLILLRRDGTPTYMLAVVADDHDMGVTHVIRGEDHLINAGRQSLIYDALGWDRPVWAHIPLIHGPDGKKLSKRHGALGVMEYEAMGYLPAGLRNYLLKLGWSSGDQEVFSDAEAVEAFDLPGVVPSPARLDFDKMGYINQQHMERENAEHLLQIALPFFEIHLTERLRKRVIAAMPTLVVRAKTLKEMVDAAAYLVAERPISLNKNARKALRGDGVERLRALTSHLARLEDDEWNAEAIQNTLKACAQELGVGFGKVGQPLRAAVTGGAASPDIGVVLELLGRDTVLGRIEDATRETD